MTTVLGGSVIIASGGSGGSVLSVNRSGNE